jgi:hypothetical protein
MSESNERQTQIDKYRALCQQAATSADVRRLDEWRMPNSAQAFDLESFADYLETHGDALACLVADSLTNGSKNDVAKRIETK